MEKKRSEGFEDTGYQVVAKVISQKGTCGFGHQVGDTVVFDGETVEGRVCLSALYSFLALCAGALLGACHALRGQLPLA